MDIPWSQHTQSNHTAFFPCPVPTVGLRTTWSWNSFSTFCTEITRTQIPLTVRTQATSETEDFAKFSTHFGVCLQSSIHAVYTARRMHLILAESVYPATTHLLPPPSQPYRRHQPSTLQPMPASHLPQPRLSPVWARLFFTEYFITKRDYYVGTRCFSKYDKINLFIIFRTAGKRIRWSPYIHPVST